MLIAGIALYRAWRGLGGTQPDFVAGHSLGEYSALVAAEALDFREAVALIRFRAQTMQNAVPEGTGGIAAILGLDDAAIHAVCEEAAQGEVLEAANYNAPGQVVIAGPRGAVERGMAAAKARGAKRAIALAMSAPSHCSLMQPTVEPLRARLAAADLRSPRMALVNNADVKTPSAPEGVRDALLRQLCSPVRWVEIIRFMAAQGVTRVIECGPGGVLTGLNKRCAEVEAIGFKDAEQIRQLAASAAMAGGQA
jgi:[acyl-carrier-protein] S-malonyltransferase